MLPPTLEKFPERLRRARKARKLTQVQLGEKLHYSNNTVSSWERGQQTPDADQIVRLCDALRVPADWLLGRKRKKVQK
jgi:transcriptional regulator with XRE-family HTH domain